MVAVHNILDGILEFTLLKLVLSLMELFVTFPILIFATTTILFSSLIAMVFTFIISEIRQIAICDTVPYDKPFIVSMKNR